MTERKSKAPSKEPTVRGRIATAERYLSTARAELQLAEPAANPALRPGLRSLVTTIGLAIDKSIVLGMECENEHVVQRSKLRATT